MIMNRITKILTFLFLLYAGSYLVYHSFTRPRVLILHSYYTEFSWVRDINVGIQRALKDRPYNIRYHYLDTKRHPQMDFKQKAGARARRMINEWRPDVVIACDDNAQQYVMKYFVDNSDISILYAGVNGDLSRYGFTDGNNVSGIAETMPWSAAKHQLENLLPPGSRLLHISDDSTSSEAVHDDILACDWVPFKMLGSHQIGTYDEWKKIVLSAEGKADCLLITHYHTIRDPKDSEKIIKPAKVIEWTEANTSLPTMGFWGFFVADGGMMAVGLSPYEQGEEAARMAVDILENGVKAKDIKPLEARLHVMYMRESKFKQRLKGKEIPVDLEAFARALGGYYE